MTGHRRRVALAVLAALTVLAAAGLWRWRLALAEALVLRAVAAAGMAGAQVSVAEIGARQARLVELRAGEPPALEVAELTLRYSLPGLLRGRVGEVDLAGLWLRGRVDGDGFSLGDAEGTAPGTGAPRGAVPALPPFDRILLRDARIELATPGGPVALTADGELVRAGERFEAALALAAKHAAGSGALAIDVHGTGSDLALALRSGSLRYEAADLGSVEATGLRGELAFPGGRVGAGELAIGSLVTPFLAPLSLNVRTPGHAGEGDAAELPIRVEIGAGEQRLLAGDGQLRADPPGAALGLAGSLAFADGALQPRDLAPAASDWIASAAGTLGLRVHASLGASGVALALHVESAGFDVATPDGVRLEGLAGKADLRGPAPFHTPQIETLRFRLADLIGPFEDGELRWRMRGRELELVDAAWSYAGGRLSTAGRFDLLAEEQPFTVHVAGLSLGQLLDQLELADLSGSGRLSGTLPLVFDGETFRVAAGTLSNDEPGVLRYAPAGAAAAGLGVGGDLEVLVGALEELHYEKLRLTLDGSLGGDVRVAGEIRGRNPRYEGGRPVELNLNLEANLPALLRGGRAVTGVPEVIERRLQGRVPAE